MDNYATPPPLQRSSPLSSQADGRPVMSAAYSIPSRLIRSYRFESRKRLSNSPVCCTAVSSSPSLSLLLLFFSVAWTFFSEATFRKALFVEVRLALSPAAILLRGRRQGGGTTVYARMRAHLFDSTSGRSELGPQHMSVPKIRTGPVLVASP